MPHLEAKKPTDDALPVVQKVAPLATMRDVQPLDMQGLFEKALAMGADGAAALEKLVDLKCKMDDRQAAKDFAAAMAAFQRECPPILCRSENTQFTVTRDGRQRARRYAKLADIEEQMRLHVTNNDFARRWTKEVVKDGMLTLSCVVTHIGGHTEESPVTLPLVAGEGATRKKVSPQQLYGLVKTYAQRHSLIDAFGLTSCDEDDDNVGETKADEPISAEQVKGLNSFMLDVKTDFEAFMAYFDIKELAELPVSRYDDAKRMLNRKLKEQETQNGR